MSHPRFGLDAAGSLVISGTGRRSIALHLEVVGARATSDGVEPVVFPWESPPPSFSTGAVADGWDVEAYVPGRAPAGLAVHATGMLAVAAHDMFLATRGGWWRRYNRWWFTGRGESVSLPIVADTAFQSCQSERATIRALIAVLKARPDLRARLSDAPVVEQIAASLSTRCLGPVTDRTGVSRDGVDILYALRQAGFNHRYGRPLPSDPIPPLDEVMARTAAQLALNPFRRSTPADPGTLEHFVRRNYTDISPWPFEGLTT